MSWNNIVPAWVLGLEVEDKEGKELTRKSKEIIKEIQKKKESRNAESS